MYFRGLGVPQQEQVRMIERILLDRDQNIGVSQHDLYDWRERQTVFEGIGAYGGGTINVTDPQRGPERFLGAFVSANTFDLLRVKPILGTSFRPDDDKAGAPLTVVLGYHAWTTRYASDPKVVGTYVKANGEDATILGVMPPGFAFPERAEIWVTRRDERSRTPNRKDGITTQAFVRLKPGVSFAQASAAMGKVTADLAREFPETNKNVGSRFRDFSTAPPAITSMLVGMQAATVFVLLIACANVANLLLARATMKNKETAIRTAIGGSRWRVVLPFFAETSWLALAGAVLGVGIAWLGVWGFDRATQNVGKPYYMIFKLDLPAFGVVFLLTLLTALVAGAAPALSVLKTDLNRTLKDEDRGSSSMLGNRLSRALVISEVALSCALLVAAGLMVKSMTRLRNYPFPFATETVFTGRLGLFDTVYPDTTARRRFWNDALDRLEAIPGAASAALSTSLPNVGQSTNNFAMEGKTYAQDKDYPSANFNGVSRGYFTALGVRMLQGREFTREDVPGSLPVAIVDRAFADKHFPGVDPIGRRIRPGGSQSTAPWRTIVGVAPNLLVKGLDMNTTDIATFYVPVTQRDDRFLSLIVRSQGAGGLTLSPAVRDVIRGLDGELPIYNVFTMAGNLENSTWFFQIFGTVFIIVGAAALFMASVGLYGVLAFSVSRRVREMGIRMALGATGQDVLRMILRQGATQISIGLSAGLVMAWGLTGVIKVVMFDTNPTDPPVFLTIALVIAVVGLLASWVPARRATTVDPIVALRYE